MERGCSKKPFSDIYYHWTFCVTSAKYARDVQIHFKKKKKDIFAIFLKMNSRKTTLKREILIPIKCIT